MWRAAGLETVVRDYYVSLDEEDQSILGADRRDDTRCSSPRITALSGSMALLREQWLVREGCSS
jgi:hypothetical protein